MSNDSEKTAPPLSAEPGAAQHADTGSVPLSFALRDSAGPLLLIVLLAIAAVPRFYQIGDANYIFDESFSLKMAEFPIGELLDRSARDPHPPFYYLLLKVWTSTFGVSPGTARALSALLGMATVAAMFFFVREAYPRRSQDQTRFSRDLMAFTAAALIALSPIHIFYSRFVRMYALATALTAISSWLLMRALLRPAPRTRDWVLFTLAAILMAYTHYFCLLTLVAQYAFAVIYLWRDAGMGARMRRIRPALMSAAFVCLEFLPWMPMLLQHREQVDHAFWSQPLSTARVGETLFALFDLNLWSRPTAGAGLIVGEIILIGSLALLASRRTGDVFILLLAVVPITAAVCISLLMRSVFVTRYLLFAQMFLLAGAVVLCFRLPTRPLRCCAALLLLGGMAFLGGKALQRQTHQAPLPGLRAAIAAYDELHSPGELLLTPNPMLFTSIYFSAEDRATIFTYGRPEAFPFFQGTAVMRDEEYLSSGALAARTDEFLWTLDAERWFGGTWSVPVPPKWEAISEQRFQDSYAVLVLRLYRRKSAVHDENRRT